MPYEHSFIHHDTVGIKGQRYGPPPWTKVVMTPEEVAILDANAEALGANMDEPMITSKNIWQMHWKVLKPSGFYVDLEIMEAMVFVLHKC